MHTISFGQTGMNTSVLAMGTWGIGGAGWDPHSDEEKLGAIAQAIEEGVNFFDTAPAYNAGVAERLLGEAIEKSGKRNELFIATKCGNDFIDGQYVRDGSAKNIHAQVERSLQNLRMDYMDLCLLHWPDDKVDIAETFGALAEVKASGKARHIGVCNHTAAQIEAARACCDIEVLQAHASLLVRDWDDALAYAKANGIATMAYGVLGGGILTGRYRELKPYEEMDNRNRFYQYFKEPGFSKAMRLLEVLDGISAAHDHAPLSEIVLCHAAARKDIDVVLFGTQKAERVSENVRALSLHLTDEEIRAIDEAADTLHGA